MIKGWVKTVGSNVCSGKGKIKVVKDYATITVNSIKYM